MDICKIAAEYGLDTLLIAVITVIFTGVVKIPLKRLAEKLQNGKKITKFITLIPIVSGFGITVLVTFIFAKEVKFGQAFYRQWLSAVSLSLAIYAFWEKFAPSKKATLSGTELEESKSVAERLKNLLETLPFLNAETQDAPTDSAADENTVPTQVNGEEQIPQTEDRTEEHRKIVLKNGQ